MPMPENPAPTMTTRCARGHGVARDEVDDDLRQLLPAVLLEEVPAADDRRVRLPLGAGDPLLQVAVGPAGDGVAVAEGAEERPVEGGQAHPGGHVGVVGGVVGPRRHEQREGACARLVGLVGERARRRRPRPRRVIGLAQPPWTMPPVGNTSTSWENFCQAKKASPGLVSPVGQEGVGRHDAGEALRVLADQAQADEAAPVLAHQGDVAAGRAGRRAARASTRRGGRTCSRRARSACRSGRSRPGRAPRSAARRR